MGHRIRISHYVCAGRNARGGCRGNCSETYLPTNRTLILLLLYDQGSQYADDGGGDRQNDQQDVIRTRPVETHLTPPVRPPRKTNQPHLNLTKYPEGSMRNSAIQPDLIAKPRLEMGARQLRRNASTPLPVCCPDRTFESSLPVSLGQPRDSYRMNERTRQIGPPPFIACGRPASRHPASITETSCTSTRVAEHRSGHASHRKRTRHHNTSSRQSTHCGNTRLPLG